MTTDEEQKMITEEKIARINALAKKKKEAGLSEAEAAEQKALYREYLASIRANLKAQLDQIEIVDEQTVQTGAQRTHTKKS